eukprot:6216225-Amphidinium_carterae.1
MQPRSTSSLVRLMLNSQTHSLLDRASRAEFTKIHTTVGKQKNWGCSRTQLWTRICDGWACIYYVLGSEYLLRVASAHAL